MQKIRLNSVVFICLGFVAVAQLVVTNLLAGSGGELSELEKRIVTVSKENETLRQELSGRTSLSVISESAKGLGLEEALNVIYLDQVESVASVIR